MGMFDHEARQFKFDVLQEVAQRAYNNELSDMTPNEIAYKLIPTPKANFRCCVYKEREILTQRTRLAMGKEPIQTILKSSRPTQVVKVIEAACDGCSIRRIQITDNCRKCMAKSCVTSCKFDAISMSANRAVIDYDKCKECGACVKSCPFNAIIETVRPCKASCPVDAISMDEYDLCVIDEDKCINCAACQSACPFGAIEDASWVVPVVNLIQSKKPVVAMVAPSIQGQFDSATLPQISEGLRLLGFKDVIEVAIGADVAAWHEKEELKAKIKTNTKMTTSCCPAFLNLAKQHFNKVYEENMSTVASPMIIMARYIKHHYPDHHVVFIGPCVAKKQEALTETPHRSVDYVLTYEEIASMFVAKGIYLSALEVSDDAQASVFGRSFAFGGGVSKALKQALKEDDGMEIESVYADGCFECKKQLLLMQHGRFTGDILEGMGCVGGCANGPAVIDNSRKAKVKFDKENLTNPNKTIKQSIEKYAFESIQIHRQD